MGADGRPAAYGGAEGLGGAGPPVPLGPVGGGGGGTPLPVPLGPEGGGGGPRAAGAGGTLGVSYC